MKCFLSGLILGVALVAPACAYRTYYPLYPVCQPVIYREVPVVYETQVVQEVPVVQMVQPVVVQTAPVVVRFRRI